MVSIYRRFPCELCHLYIPICMLGLERHMQEHTISTVQGIENDTRKWIFKFKFTDWATDLLCRRRLSNLNNGIDE